MKIISHNDIMGLNIDSSECYNWSKEVLISKNNCYLPAKISMKQEGHRFYNIMPCIIDDLKVTGVKTVVRQPNNIPSLDSQILLYDTDTGNLKAIMDGNFITTMRTGAVAALSIINLSRSDSNVIGMIGLGNVAMATMDIFLKQIGTRNFNIKLYRYKDQAENFIERYKNYTNINFTICDTYKDIIIGSDIIISSVTYTDINFGEDHWFKEGCLVVPIHTLGFQNCDLFFDKVICDDIAHIEGFKYFKQFKNVTEFTDILLKQKTGRDNDTQRILSYNIGIALQDIYYAEKIYQKCLDNKLSIKFEGPKEKFWL